MKVRTKAIVKDAIQWTGSNAAELLEFGRFHPVEVEGEKIVQIITPDGVMSASEGDWIIKGIKGEFYPCKPEIFEATYERVEGE